MPAPLRSKFVVVVTTPAAATSAEGRGSIPTRILKHVFPGASSESSGSFRGQGARRTKGELSHGKATKCGKLSPNGAPAIGSISSTRGVVAAPESRLVGRKGLLESARAGSCVRNEAKLAAGDELQRHLAKHSRHWTVGTRDGPGRCLGFRGAAAVVLAAMYCRLALLPRNLLYCCPALPLSRPGPARPGGAFAAR